MRRSGTKDDQALQMNSKDIKKWRIKAQNEGIKIRMKKQIRVERKRGRNRLIPCMVVSK